MNNRIKQIIFIMALVGILLLPYFVFAQNSAMDGLKLVGNEGGYSPKTDDHSLSEFLGTIVNSVLSLLGVLFIVLMLYGGYNWMIAAGDEQKLERAKNTIKRAIVGLIILVSSFAIWNFILWRLITPES